VYLYLSSENCDDLLRLAKHDIPIDKSYTWSKLCCIVRSKIREKMLKFADSFYLRVYESFASHCQFPEMRAIECDFNKILNYIMHRILINPRLPCSFL
jgi:hypothetical protein